MENVVEKKKIGIGFLGTGNVSVLHAEAIKRNPRGELIAVWNRTWEKSRERAEQFGCRVCREPEEIVSDPEVDAVFILTNLETHHQFATLALKHGKHVLVEKPVSDSVNKIDDLNRLSKETGMVCMPGHNMIYEDSILRSSEIIKAGELGKIISVYVMYNFFVSEELASQYPGIIRQILTHNVYTLLYLGGRPHRVTALKASLHYEKLTIEDIAMAIFELDNGALAHVSASFGSDDLSADPWTFVIKVIGTKGTVRYSYQDWVLALKTKYHSKTYAAYQGTITNEVAHFIDICLYGGEPRSTMNDASAAQEIIQAVERSIEEEKTICL
ncbi:MAG TPA: Gfo/Idh/MocA family oxidoreductase [Desulfobacterales bacterium]|nr:Gfo/Idh/MocA family oxidoreductase [Desulfobacterales bacterium]